MTGHVLAYTGINGKQTYCYFIFCLFSQMLVFVTPAFRVNFLFFFLIFRTYLFLQRAQLR